ncbi:MAG TPA: hypothetical protein VGM81_16345 [Burkholderiaceae bacterium]|jgi:hypothetical protein
MQYSLQLSIKLPTFQARPPVRRVPTRRPVPTVLDRDPAELWSDSWFASSLDLADGVTVAEGMSLEEFDLWCLAAEIEPEQMGLVDKAG